MTETAPPERTDLALFAKSLDGQGARQRLAAIIDRPDVIRVVRAQPVQDLFWAIKEVGPTDCLELLELLSPEQVQGFIDLDSWRGDRIDPKALGDWLELFYEASPFNAVKQLLGLDIELLTLLFKLHVKAYDLIEEEEVPGDPLIQTVTPDNRYCLVFDEQVPKLSMALKQTVERLYGIRPRFIIQLINSLSWELPSSLEEECYRWRNGRMADLGFLPIDEALMVFGYRNPDVDLPIVARGHDSMGDDTTTDLSTSVLLADDIFGENVVAKTLALFEEDLQRQIKRELVLVANRVHTASGGDPGDPGAALDTLKRTLHTIGIGLSYLSKGNPDLFTDLFEQHSVVSLFQVGHSVGVRLQRELRARVKSPVSGLSGEGLLRLDSPLREIAAGILKARPVFYAGLTDESRVDYIHFRSIEDTAHAAVALTEAAFRAAILGPKGLGLTDEIAAEIGVSSTLHGPSHGAYLATWLARVLLSLPEGFDALSLEQVEQLKGVISQKVRAIDAFASVAEQSIPLPGADDKNAASKRARLFATTVLNVLEHELAELDGDKIRAVYTQPWLVEIAQIPDAEENDG